jgi:tRNA-2-methylthio-N6-dimethylallyladenosine synthase
MSVTLNKDVDENRQGEAIEMEVMKPTGKKLYLESYGCAMNFSDSEVVASILIDQGFTTTKDQNDADVVLINTCSIRDNAEQRVRNRLTQFNKIKKEKPGDQLVRRRGRLYRINKSDPRRKARQG